MKQHFIIKLIKEELGIDTSQRSRRRDVVDARSAAMVALRPHHSLHQIGEIFSYKSIAEGEEVWQPMSHCTVLHAIKAHEYRYHPDAQQRKLPYIFYGAVYDMVRDAMGSPKEKVLTLRDMETAIENERYLRREAEQRLTMLQAKLDAEVSSAKEEVKVLQRELKKLERKSNKLAQERDKIQSAFKQLVIEKKIRDEKIQQKA